MFLIRARLLAPRLLASLVVGGFGCALGAIAGRLLKRFLLEDPAQNMSSSYHTMIFSNLLPPTKYTLDGWCKMQSIHQTTSNAHWVICAKNCLTALRARTSTTWQLEIIARYLLFSQLYIGMYLYLLYFLQNILTNSNLFKQVPHIYVVVLLYIFHWLKKIPIWSYNF